MKRLIIVLLMVISMQVSAQTGEKNFIDQNYIEVSGKAEMEVVPDMIYLKIILSDKDNKNNMSLEKIDKAMINKLTEIGIDVGKDLSVKDLTSSFRQYWLSKNDIILTKKYQLIVHDAKTLEKVYSEFQQLGISNVNIEKIDHSRMEQFRKEVKVNAIKAAKEKAESLVAAINQSIGKAIYIQEMNYFNPYVISNALQSQVSGVFGNSMKGSEDYVNASAVPEIEFEKIKLESSILVKFELK